MLDGRFLQTFIWKLLPSWVNLVKSTILAATMYYMILYTAKEEERGKKGKASCRNLYADNGYCSVRQAVVNLQTIILDLVHDRWRSSWIICVFWYNQIIVLWKTIWWGVVFVLTIVGYLWYNLIKNDIMLCWVKNGCYKSFQNIFIQVWKNLVVTISVIYKCICHWEMCTHID